MVWKEVVQVKGVMWGWQARERSSSTKGGNAMSDNEAGEVGGGVEGGCIEVSTWKGDSLGYMAGRPVDGSSWNVR